ncbi:OmpA family protein [Terriglobus albidus]|uniref:OmpA family protein n=1 Tax=Terriglobus albidus TaxID=1592106 RepID=A0A5B9E9L1_9BACT|nr:OmpA family protein [Terriglobus albidus]QEE27845.1 OmpA family protein [Terriglobus albidus]
MYVIYRYTFYPILLAAASLPLAATAQEPNPTNTSAAQQSRPPAGAHLEGEYNGVPLYRVTVVQRDLDAVNYMHRSGSTTLELMGTPLLANAKGKAVVKSDKGRMTVDVKVDHLPPANGFGPEYLTYVLWAITPDGHPQNLGELLPSGNDVSISVTTGLQSFGLMITAEPYYAVRVPSDVVVLENHVIENKTNGVVEKVNAHYTLLPRGQYISQTSGSKTVMNPITRDEKSPLELYEAHNAYRIAVNAGAEKYEPEIMAQVKQNLDSADSFDQNKHGDRKQEVTFAREVVQRSEDARISTLRKIAAEQRQAEVDARKAAELQAANSQAAAEAEAAQRARAEAETAKARARAAEAAQTAASAQQSASEAREKLRQQLNSVLTTQETARGLIVNMSDVLFDTGKYTLKPDTKVALAKVSGILMAYPSLKVQVEGHTDSVGGDDYNQKLSENRAGTVAGFLTTEGVPQDNVTAKGFGKTRPVADNTTAQGRQQNRRVELVVSGAAIGVKDSENSGAGVAANTETSKPTQTTGTSTPPSDQPH